DEGARGEQQTALDGAAGYLDEGAALGDVAKFSWHAYKRRKTPRKSLKNLCAPRWRRRARRSSGARKAAAGGCGSPPGPPPPHREGEHGVAAHGDSRGRSPSRRPLILGPRPAPRGG